MQELLVLPKPLVGMAVQILVVEVEEQENGMKLVRQEVAVQE
jgi:hypothetical protein